MRCMELVETNSLAAPNPPGESLPSQHRGGELAISAGFYERAGNVIGDVKYDVFDAGK